jgi:hypothetical protein
MSVLKLCRPYVSLVLLLVPPALFGLLLVLFRHNARLQLSGGFPYLPWQFLVVAGAGVVATLGGILDWRYHRNPLNLKIPKKERDAEAAALGLGGVPMFALMSVATLRGNPTVWLIPIVVVLIYTVVAICYDEFVFHRKRCGPVENAYHRMLVFGNGAAWLAWFHLIYC